MRKIVYMCQWLKISKAFDYVHHAILLSKLNNYGIRENFRSCFESKFTDPTQIFTYNIVC